MEKQYFILVALVLLMLLESCSESNLEQEKLPNSTRNVSLAGRAYLPSDKVGANCEIILSGTDYWPTFMFINDSVFIKTIDNCCMPTTVSHYSGKYILTTDMLLLTYDSLQVVYTSPMEKDSSAGIYTDIPDTIEVEQSDLQVEKLERFNCSNKPYFKQTSEPWEGQFIAMSNDRLEDYIKKIKNRRVWSKLMISK